MHLEDIPYKIWPIWKTKTNKTGSIEGDVIPVGGNVCLCRVAGLKDDPFAKKKNRISLAVLHTAFIHVFIGCQIKITRLKISKDVMISPTTRLPHSLGRGCIMKTTSQLALTNSYFITKRSAYS